MTPTAEQNEAQASALIFERTGYEAKVRLAEEKGDDDMKARYAERIAQVDKQLALVGKAGKKPAARAERMS